MTERSGYYLQSLLTPLAPWLVRSDVTDIWINRERQIWVETLSGAIESHAVPALDERQLYHLARQIAALSAQGINREQPLLAAMLPDGARVQIVGPPATRNGHVFAIRRHIASRQSLREWEGAGAFSGLVGKQALEPQRRYRTLSAQEAPGYVAKAVRQRRNIIVAGGTSTGKTTFLNALLDEIPKSERLVVIEDTQELKLDHPNSIGLIAARGSLAEAQISAEDLLIAALRLRPDRIILGELRGHEAFTFLRAINSGHPGSMTTVHADSPSGAIEQLVLLVLQSGNRLSRDDVRHYIKESIDVFVQLERAEGKRRIAEVLVKEAVR